MLTDIQIINQGLSGLSSSRIRSISPANTPLEAFMKANYPQWKRSELTKRRWVFATEDDYALTLSATLTGVAKPYKYALPNDCLRPIRTNCTEWKQRGRFVFSCYSTLTLNYIRNALEEEFDPLFDDVLAARVRLDSCEYVTQSNSKYQSAQEYYKEAVYLAGQANAYVIGSEDIAQEDSSFSWIDARVNGFNG